MVTNMRRALDDVAEERSSIEAEIARSLDHAAQLNSGIASATADGYAPVARQLHEELSETYAFLAELAAARQTVIAEENRSQGSAPEGDRRGDRPEGDWSEGSQAMDYSAYRPDG